MDKISIYYRQFILQPKYQLFIGILFLLFFNITISLLGNLNLFELSLSSDSVINYLSSIATIVGIVGAVILGHFFFFFQTIENKQQNWFLALKSEIDNLVDILHKMPVDFQYLLEPLHECIRVLQTRKLGDYPIAGEDWKPIHKPANIAVEKDVIGHPLVYKMIISLGKIEEFASEIGVSKIAIICSSFILKSIKKLFYLLLFSVGTVFFFYLIRDKYIVHPLVIGSLMLIFLYFVCIAILETLFHLFDYYRETVPEANRDDIAKYI